MPLYEWNESEITLILVWNLTDLILIMSLSNSLRNENIWLDLGIF